MVRFTGISVHRKLRLTGRLHFTPEGESETYLLKENLFMADII